MPKPKTSTPVRPNAGVEQAYYKRLRDLVEEMQKSFVYWMRVQYRKTPPRVAELAEDAVPSKEMQKRLAEIADKWKKRFEELAPQIAELYSKDMFKSADSAFMKSLGKAGWTVQFEMNPTVRDALSAQIEQNITLINSIPDQYYKDLEGAVMRSYANGRDLETLTKDVQAIYPVTRRRAELIARDQTSKATAVVNRTRQLELGITEAIWMHSGAGKHPRPSHVKANGKRYKIAEGMLIDGRYVFPGEEINCRCTSRPVLPI